LDRFNNYFQGREKKFFQAGLIFLNLFLLILNKIGNNRLPISITRGEIK